MTVPFENRPRHRIQQEPGLVLDTWVNYSPGGPADYHSTVITPPTLSRVTDDVLNRPYKQRVSSGEVFNNPFSSYKTTFSVNEVSQFTAGPSDDSNPSHYHTVAQVHSWLTELYLSGSLRFPDVTFDTEDLVRKAQIQAIGNVNKTEFDAGTFAAEWHKTKMLHKDLGNALIKALTLPRKSRKRYYVRKKVAVLNSRGEPLLNRFGKPVYTTSVRRVDDQVASNTTDKLKDLSNLYLTVRYGLGPALADLESACKYLDASRALRRTARGTFSISDSKEYVQDVAVYDSFHVNVNLRRVRTVVGRYGILYESSRAATLLAQAGLSRPLTTAWNLLPWSFVADWFVGVGAWLDAVQPNFASKTLSAWESTLEVNALTASFSGSASLKPDPHHYWTASMSGGLSAVTEHKVRSPWNPTVPKSPSLGSGFNQLRSLDFANLVMQKLRFR